MKKVLVLALLTVVLVACATSPTGRRQLMLVSPDQAISASKTAYVQQMRAFDEKGLISQDRQLVQRVNSHHRPAGGAGHRDVSAHEGLGMERRGHRRARRP
jgi:outer membrane biogenesis lipoprotein LolB